MDPALFNSMLSLLADPVTILCIMVGVILGFTFGALPGLTATLGVALLTPLTFPLPVEQAVAMMCALYCGSMTGGAIPAILLRMPGTPSAMVTTFDGYPMMKQGRAIEAYGWALTASIAGGIISWLCLAVVAPPLARLALRLGPPEYAMLALLSMTIIASVSPGRVVKGVAGAFLGIGLSVVGFDQISGEARWMFNTLSLSQGVNIMPAMIGLLVIPEIFTSMYMVTGASGATGDIDRRRMFAPIREYLRLKWHFVGAGLIGTAIGMVPALGGNVASMLSYDFSRHINPNGKNYGNGEPGGVVASEGANNGVTGGALIPLLTLGIPGDSVTAMLLGGLMIHGLQPGPRLFETSGPTVWTIIASILIANVFVGVVGYFGIRGFVKVLVVPKVILAPCLLVLTVIGTYALTNQVFDVVVMLCLGMFGFFCVLAEFPVYPIVIGIILGPLLEAELRRALVISGGDWSIFVNRPMAALFLALTFVALFGPTLVARLRSARQRRAAQA